MKFICPICSNVELFCLSVPCKGCSYTLHQREILLEDFNKIVNAVADVIVGPYMITGDTNSVAIRYLRTNGFGANKWPHPSVIANANVPIASFINISPDIIKKLIESGEWDRLEKAKTFL